MTDIPQDHHKPQTRPSTEFGPDTSGVPTQNSDKVEAPKLGSESIANFGEGPGLHGGGVKIH
jgi:hypothetical protein